MSSDDRSLREKGDAGHPITFDSSPEASPVAAADHASGDKRSPVSPADGSPTAARVAKKAAQFPQDDGGRGRGSRVRSLSPPRMQLASRAPLSKRYPPDFDQSIVDWLKSKPSDAAGSAGAADFAGSAGAADFAGSAGPAPRRQIYVGGGGAGFMPYEPSGAASAQTSEPPMTPEVEDYLRRKLNNLHGAYMAERDQNNAVYDTRKANGPGVVQRMLAHQKALPKKSQIKDPNRNPYLHIQRLVDGLRAWQMPIFDRPDAGIQDIIRAVMEKNDEIESGRPYNDGLPHDAQEAYEAFIKLFPKI